MKKKLFFAFLVGVILPLVATYLFVSMGGMPVSTKDPPLPFERKLAHLAIRAAMQGHINNSPPIEANEGNLLEGAKLYLHNCAVCHSLPDKPSSLIAKGLFPKPPAFFTQEDSMTEDPVGTLYWKIKNGIRMTGMPGFADELSETQMWQMTLLLHETDKLPATVRDYLQNPPTGK